MNDKDYQSQAAVTLSKQFHGEAVSVTATLGDLRDAIAFGNGIDATKKLLFYGKNKPEFNPSYNLNSLVATEKQKDILHCLIGIFTEGVEMLEAVEAAIMDAEKNGGTLVFDTVNIAEEMGDVCWYMANLANALNIELSSVKATNIAKLRKRYSDKFDAFEAQNRDLAAERAILEGVGK